MIQAKKGKRMFDNILKELQRLNGTKVSVTIEADEEGDIRLAFEKATFNQRVAKQSILRHETSQCII